jgi:hypothetical protein
MIKQPTPAECDIARKVLYSMEAHGKTTGNKYVSYQETVRICERREAKSWKD